MLKKIIMKTLKNITKPKSMIPNTLKNTTKTLNLKTLKKMLKKSSNTLKTQT